MTYLWVKALHIISVICWMAGLFYLPRLYVYHCGAEAGSPTSETFKVMERKLLRFIMNPAMAATWVFGIWLVVLMPEYLEQTWFHLKATFVLVLTLFHHVLALQRKTFALDQNRRSHKYYRVINEIPTVAMIVIVFAVVLRP